MCWGDVIGNLSRNATWLMRGISSTDEYLGALGNMSVTSTLDQHVRGPSDPDSVRQYHSCSVPQSSRKNQKSFSRTLQSSLVSCIQHKHRKLAGRFSQQVAFATERGVSTPGDFPGPVSRVGDARCGPHGLQVKQIGQVYIQAQGSTGGNMGWSGSSIGSSVPPDLCLYYHETSFLSASGEHCCVSYSSRLAQEDAVHPVRLLLQVWHL